MHTTPLRPVALSVPSVNNAAVGQRTNHPSLVGSGVRRADRRAPRESDRYAATNREEDLRRGSLRLGQGAARHEAHALRRQTPRANPALARGGSDEHQTGSTNDEPEGQAGHSGSARRSSHDTAPLAHLIRFSASTHRLGNSPTRSCRFVSRRRRFRLTVWLASDMIAAQ